MWVEVANLKDIVPGGMKKVDVEGEEIVICNNNGKIFAIERRCGHMNAPLDLGSLEEYIVTCPMHNVQFDITTGEALSPSIPHDFGGEIPPPPGMAKYFGVIANLMANINIHNLKTYPVKVEGEIIKIQV